MPSSSSFKLAAEDRAVEHEILSLGFFIWRLDPGRKKFRQLTNVWRTCVHKEAEQRQHGEKIVPAKVSPRTSRSYEAQYRCQNTQRDCNDRPNENLALCWITKSVFKRDPHDGSIDHRLPGGLSSSWRKYSLVSNIRFDTDSDVNSTAKLYKYPVR